MLVIVGWCALALAACAAVIVDSLLPGAPRLPPLIWIAAFVGMFPAYGLVLAKIATRTKGSLPERQRAFLAVIRAVPKPMALGVVLAFAVFFISFFVLLAVDPQGQPQATPNGYQAVEHGKVTPLSEQEYRRDLAAAYRAFAAGAALFTTTACAGAFALRRLGRQEAQPEGRPPTIQPGAS